MITKRTCIDQLLWEKCSNMGDDLLIEIFQRLAVKTLARMRCVCKSWNSVITSHSFITHHLQQSSFIRATHKSYIALNRIGTIHSYAFYHPDQVAPSFEHCNNWFRRLPFVEFPFHQLIFIDAIHGVVCLTSSSGDPSSPTILWNPTIRKYVKIPTLPFKCHDSSHYVHAIGFGFHSRKDDLRVIRLWIPIQLKASPKRRVLLGYQVFSPQDDVWKKAVSTSRIRPGRVITEASFFMNGTIHWIVSAYKVKKDTEYYRLLMFDCEREEFTEMVLPEAFNRRRYECETIRAVIFKCRGMLAVLMLISTTFELWVMEEYGVSGSWKKWFDERDCLLDFCGVASEESMLLMDAKRRAVSYTEKHCNEDGKVYYKIGGRTSEYINIYKKKNNMYINIHVNIYRQNMFCSS